MGAKNVEKGEDATLGDLAHDLGALAHVEDGLEHLPTPAVRPEERLGPVGHRNSNRAWQIEA